MTQPVAPDLDNIDEAIYAKVRDAIAEALGLDDDEVELGSKLIDDLGAESLDFLDIVFRLERTFDIKIPRGGVEAQSRAGLDDDAVYELDGVLTPLGCEKLAEAMPEVPAEEITANFKSAEIPTLFRVATFYRIVAGLLAEKAA